MNKVFIARRRLYLAEDIYRIAINNVKKYESDNPPPTDFLPLNEVIRKCQENCKRAKNDLTNAERVYNEVRLDFIRYLVSSIHTQE